MLDWSKNHFDVKLFQKFVQSVGIHPMGTLVKLRNGLLGVVIRPNRESLLHPVIKVVMDTKTKKKLKPEEVDLLEISLKKRKSYEYTIISSENIEDWNINPAEYMAEPQLYMD